jgi:hypothetical protein
MSQRTEPSPYQGASVYFESLSALRGYDGHHHVSHVTMGMRSIENDWTFPPRVAACGVDLMIDIIDSPERSGVRLRNLTLFRLANPQT